MRAWKSLKLVDGKIKSDSGNHTWSIGRWYHEDNIELYHKGFHASELVIDAMQLVTPDVFAIVEYKGKIIKKEDKFVSEDMRILKAYEWTKPDSLRFSIFCVKQSMKYFDRVKYPEVWKVCLNSIKAINAVLVDDNETTASAESAAWSAWSTWLAESAAWSARSARSAWSAAWSARSAESAAWSARSAESAAWSARSAESAARSAWSAAWSARSAESAAWSATWSARSAESAAWSAWSAAKLIQHKWLIKYIKKNCKIIGGK